MILELNQTLHGYEHGHQLLATSTELSNSEKKVLLFQSDLSGSSVDEGFDHYLTGYPIAESGRYAFAKTWYANEMRRPGCVWTHTLLINFSDLGRIPDFSVIEKLFKRPVLSDYEQYQQPIEVDLNRLLLDGSYENLELSDVAKGMLEGLYLEPDAATLVPAKNSDEYKKYALDLWSEQWPRLRRNFTFCTGALSLKTLDERVYDLQIVPRKNLLSIERKTPKVFISHHSSNQVDDLAEIMTGFSQSLRRKFLWTYGADIEGQRKNYIPLLKIFESVYKPGMVLEEIFENVRHFFPDNDQARLLKINLFGKDSMLQGFTTEVQLLRFLANKNVDFIDPSELQIEERILKLLIDRTINLSSFYLLWKEVGKQSISQHTIEQLDINPQDLLEGITRHPELADLFASKLPALASTPDVWKLNLSTQVNLLKSLLKLGPLNDNVLANILYVRSPVILNVYELAGDRIIEQSLNWLNSNKDLNLYVEWAKEISHNIGVVKRWFHNSQNTSISVYRFVFSYFNFGKIRKLDFTSSELVSMYQKLSLAGHANVFITTVVFSLGLDPKLKSGEAVIQITYSALYQYAASSQIIMDYWAIIPLELNYDDDHHDEPHPFFFFFPFQKSKKERPRYKSSGDYREMLTRTIVNTFISRSWAKEVFISTVTGPEAFKRAIDYCLTFNDGAKFLYDLIENIQARSRASDYQKKMLTSTNL